MELRILFPTYVRETAYSQQVGYAQMVRWRSGVEV